MNWISSLHTNLSSGVRIQTIEQVYHIAQIIRDNLDDNKTFYSAALLDLTQALFQISTRE